MNMIIVTVWFDYTDYLYYKIKKLRSPCSNYLIALLGLNIVVILTIFDPKVSINLKQTI